MSKTNPAKTDLSFEEALKQLESIVETMEGGNVPLDELVAKFEKGTELLRHCQRKLGEAELKVEKLKQASPTLQTEEFEITNDSAQG